MRCPCSYIFFILTRKIPTEQNLVSELFGI
nr:MAG TPA: hypothetical protein [Caudoviricetes sp.]